MKRRQILFVVPGFLLAYFLLVTLAVRYNQYPYDSWQSEIYSDKAGYYIYLPATFIHGYHQSDYPEGFEDKLGKGFNFIEGKLFVKYPIGVAVLVSPFFLGAHLYALAGQGPADGFSGSYYEMTNYAGVFYFMLGGVMLFLFLRRRYSLTVSLLTTALVLFGTNLYYYAFRESLMSHVYSFALFALLLVLTDKLWKKPTGGRLVLVALVSGMILLVRPSNIIFLPVILFLDITARKDMTDRLHFLFNPTRLGGSILIIILVFIPQMIYWRFYSGHILFNPYGGERFLFWDHPQVAKALFSPANGLLTYSPAYFLILPGILVMYFNKETNRWLVPVLFILLLYITSSWWDYRFGCSFGQRSFVEYLAFFSVPVASFFRWSFQRFYPYLWGFMMLVAGYLIYVNIALTGIYDKCYFGEDWEWEPYQMYFKKAGIIPFIPKKESLSWYDDFEQTSNPSFSHYHVFPFEKAYSGNRISRLDEGSKFSDSFDIYLQDEVTGRLWYVDVSLQCYFPETTGKTLVICSIGEGDSILYHHSRRIEDRHGPPSSHWNHVEASFHMNGLPPMGRLKVYVWMVEGTEVYVDDLRVTIRYEKRKWEPR